MRSLERIEVQGFKSIQEMDLLLRNLNIMIGANGAGKTNFISVFELLNHLVEGNLQLYIGQSGGADRLLHYGRKATSEIVIRLHFGANGYEARLAPSAGDALVFAHESCWFHDSDKYPQPFNVYLGSGHKETLLHDAAVQSEVADYVLKDLRSWKVYHFHDTSDSAKIKATCDIEDNAALRPDASNLAAFLYWLREVQREYYGRIAKTIRLVAPFFNDFALQPSRLNRKKIQLEWSERDSDMYFDAHTLSDGTLRFICLATLLLQPTLPSTVLIDEPELGLHPYAITLLASMLKSVAAQTQVIVSTQSASLVDQFSPRDIIVVDREGRQSKFNRLNTRRLKQWLQEYSLGELWEKNIIGGRPSR